MRLAPDEKLLSALADIADFKPNEIDGDPYQQIAVYAKTRARDAIRDYVRHDTVLYRPFIPERNEE